MSQNDPEVLRAEIERTRAELSNNVDTLTDTANPKNIAHRQADKVKSAARGVREHLMGAPDDPYDAGTLGDRRDAVQDKVGAVQDRAAGALDTVADAPAASRRPRTAAAASTYGRSSPRSRDRALAASYSARSLSW